MRNHDKKEWSEERTELTKCELCGMWLRKYAICEDTDFCKHYSHRDVGF